MSRNDQASCCRNGLSRLWHHNPQANRYSYVEREHTNYRKEDLIFGTPISGIDLSLFHPPPAQIFKLWQIYLDNVDPLLKVTHTPTLQPRIIDAIGDLSSVGPALNCLLYGIYCIAVLTLQAGECGALFGASKDDLLVSA